MSFHIYAWLENGIPRLQVIEAHSGAIYLSWRYQETNQDSQPKGKKEIQRLFKDLLLLTCKQEMKNCRLFKTEPDHNQCPVQPIYEISHNLDP
ncbi:MAG: hypothetical protein DRQ61_01660 [Gammaproteobacteria bacterium]|nr:MAG: hypothetical protein DRQ61_01660 [Gammaproteobacteria bacterium]